MDESDRKQLMNNNEDRKKQVKWIKGAQTIVKGYLY